MAHDEYKARQRKRARERVLGLRGSGAETSADDSTADTASAPTEGVAAVKSDGAKKSGNLK
jgi:hypothetical protein